MLSCGIQCRLCPLPLAKLQAPHSQPPACPAPAECLLSSCPLVQPQREQGKPWLHLHPTPAPAHSLVMGACHAGGVSAATTNKTCFLSNLQKTIARMIAVSHAHRVTACAEAGHQKHSASHRWMLLEAMHGQQSRRCLPRSTSTRCCLAGPTAGRLQRSAQRRPQSICPCTKSHTVTISVCHTPVPSMPANVAMLASPEILPTLAGLLLSLMGDVHLAADCYRLVLTMQVLEKLHH